MFNSRPDSLFSERIVTLLLILGLFLGCAIVPPVPIDLTRFADNSSAQNLTFDSAGNQPFELTLTKYTVVGNNSLTPEGGVIRNITFTACPIEHMGSNVSNLTMNWPAGGSTPFFSGTLDSCQQLSVDPLLFNEYLSVRSADSTLEIINNPGIANFSIGAISFLMMKNPRMYHYDEPVTYTFAVPYGPISMIANITGEEIPPEYWVYENTRIHGIRYTCRSGDSIRTMYGPTRSWNISITLPPMDLTGLVGVNITNRSSADATFSLFDLPCPAYGTPGKYYAEVTELYVDLTNYTGPLPQSGFRDDFNTSTLNPHWDLRLVNGSGLAELDNDYLNGQVHLRSNSPSSDSGMALYYSTPISPPVSSTAGVMIETYISDWEVPDGNYSGIFFLNETANPGPTASMVPLIRGMLAFDDDQWIVYCPTAAIGVDPPNATGTMPSGPHTAQVLITNNATAFILDGSPAMVCEAPAEDFYVAFTSDPVTDSFNGNITLEYVEIMDVEYVSGWNGTLWMDMSLLPLGGSSYADVIVCDCPDRYNRNFTFSIGSDSPGVLELSNINVSYQALISYGGEGMAPTTSIDNSNFSWVGINSRVSDSDVLYQTGLYNSTVTNSEVVFSSLPCYTVSNSNVIMGVMIPPSAVGQVGTCDNRIEDSYLNFVFMVGGGSAVNSRLSGFLIAFTDFQDALVENLTLYEGTMILNGSRASIFQNPLDLGDIPLGIGMPLACSEGAFFAIDSAANLSIGDLSAGSIDCRFRLFNSNVTIYNLTFDNEFGGIKAELGDSTLFVRDMPNPVNITVYGGDTDVVFWNVNISEFGTLILSSEDMDVDNGFASVNGEANGGMLANLSSHYRTTLIFYNVTSFNGNIGYYENFTTNRTEASQLAVNCPISICSNFNYDSNTRILTVDVNSFSSYVLDYNYTPPSGGGGDENRELSISVSGECVGEAVQFNATSGASRVPDVNIRIYYPVSGFSYVHTGTGGTATFTPSQEGAYSFSAHLAGYEEVDGTFPVEECAPPVPPVQNETVAPVSLAQETPEEGTGGTIAPEQPPAQPPEEIEVPAQPPAQPLQEGTPQEQPEGAPPTAQPATCCFLFCAQLFGICWYWWLLIIILIIGGAYALSKSLAK